MDSSFDSVGIDVPESLPRSKTRRSHTHDTLVGLDIAKAVFQLAVSSRPGRFDSQPRLSREQLLAFFAQLPPAVVVMDACGSAHFWAA